MKAARNLLAKLRSKKLSLVESVEQLCDAYTDVAYYDVSSYKKLRTSIKLPPACPLLRLSGQVAIPTVDLAVDRACHYENVVYVSQFETYFQLAGGVNLPKIVTCIGSDGKRRKQLIKVSGCVCLDGMFRGIYIYIYQGFIQGGFPSSHSGYLTPLISS